MQYFIINPTYSSILTIRRILLLNVGLRKRKSGINAIVGEYFLRQLQHKYKIFFLLATTEACEFKLRKTLGLLFWKFDDSEIQSEKAWLQS